MSPTDALVGGARLQSAQGVGGTHSYETGFVGTKLPVHCAQTMSAVLLPSVKILPVVHWPILVQVAASLVELK